MNIKELDDLVLNECFQFYALHVISYDASLHVCLVQKDEIVYDGSEMYKRPRREVILNKEVSSGKGHFYFGKQPLYTPDVVEMCRNLEWNIARIEQDESVREDAHNALDAVRKVIDAKNPFSDMAESYIRIAKILQLSSLTDIVQLGAEQLHTIMKEIEEYKNSLKGTPIFILNISSLRPLVYEEHGIFTYVFNPRMDDYRTGTKMAQEFRERLRLTVSS